MMQHHLSGGGIILKNQLLKSTFYGLTFSLPFNRFNGIFPFRGFLFHSLSFVRHNFIALFAIQLKVKQTLSHTLFLRFLFVDRFY
jgi:hypothetical protein